MFRVADIDLLCSYLILLCCVEVLALSARFEPYQWRQWVAQVQEVLQTFPELEGPRLI